MMRQSSSRNQRYKGGFRFRHFLQICLLLAICIWLVYQVKHSQDKKRAFVERKEVEDQAFSFRFGRKDLPLVKEDELVRETHNVDEDELQEQEMKKEDDAQDEEGGGDVDVDDWIDEQDRDQRGEEDEPEENESLLGEANSVERVDKALDARGLDGEKPNVTDANVKGSSSNVSVDVSNKIYNSSNNGSLNGFIGNHSNIGLGENATLHEGTDHSMNGTLLEKSESGFGVSNHENGSNSSSITVEENNHNVLHTNSTMIRLPMVTAISATNLSESLMKNGNLSTMADSPSYKEIRANETASLMVVDRKHTIQNATTSGNHAKSKDMVVEDLKLKTSEEQESDDQFATISFSKNEVRLSRTTITEEEREARTDLSTLPEIHNDLRHDYEETEE